ncbi:alpha/beta-hydrolase [Mollisia scopiformis]|uniref:Alpha/beta-hydrolase n=1 Tax=Mollisia scopiformis TaxID=149040 RepID=A0A194XC41_MOLSC|nr:alpha/beta-hydrolase [Mollisia scopiformis]KUJ17726.1 alpha/beta-hydrolase [Mollisia scopiformis]
MEASTAALNSGDEIRPYRIHVSSKYLELTKKKLELTRLPHEVLLSKDREWEFGTPKGVVEPLIDFWLEHYTWRNREETLNTSLPQFRTAISLPPPNPPLENETAKPALRIHFIHLHSPHPNAVPLLLLPPFPLTNLSLSTSPLFNQLTNPEHPTSTQAFHIICPSIPGLGFSDAFTKPSTSQLEQTAYLFNTLMLRLGYEHYLCSSTGSGRQSPAGIDYHLARTLGEKHKENCLAIHVVEPCISAPTATKDPLSWMKFNLAKFFHANIWGYEAADWTALRSSSLRVRNNRKGERRPLLSTSSGGPAYGAITTLGLREPTTFSYALCDSPVGMLSLICSALQKANPEHKLTDTQIVDITQLAWLPGPEAGMRFWSAAAAAQQVPLLETGVGQKKARIAVTAFNADGLDEESGYVCPAWISSSHELVFAQRVPGKARLTIWERSEVLVAGIRRLARAMDALDARFRVRPLDEVVVAPDDGVIVEEREIEEEDEEEGHGMQMDVESPDTIVAVDMS